MQDFLLGADPNSAFGLGLLLGFIVGTCAFYLAEHAVTASLARVRRPRPGPWTLDDRPLAVRGDLRTRVSEDLRARSHGSGVSPLRPRDGGVGDRAAANRPSVLDGDAGAHDRDTFIRRLQAQHLHIDELRIEKD